jgi:hypothetical protein
MPIHIGPGSRIDESTTTRGASLADVPAPIDGVAKEEEESIQPQAAREENAACVRLLVTSSR